ncbi:hypothetical protein M885DRAFT_536118 [Pelagophyceae sp. CCMP2097]|nr:hypothetical protein M885DRAFT_536118 [Pelagophyceae sp. CCMP2097]
MDPKPSLSTPSEDRHTKPQIDAFRCGEGVPGSRGRISASGGPRKAVVHRQRAQQGTGPIEPFWDFGLTDPLSAISGGPYVKGLDPRRSRRGRRYRPSKRTLQTDPPNGPSKRALYARPAGGPMRTLDNTGRRVPVWTTDTLCGDLIRRSDPETRYDNLVRGIKKGSY